MYKRQVLIGAALSAAGASYQGIFRNPMVSPDILGAATGASFGAALAILFGASALMIQVSAFCFGLAAVAAAYFASSVLTRQSGEMCIRDRYYGNASALYRIGRDSHKAVEDARKQIASLIHAGPMDIYFTSCGTEADNWAVKGVAHKMKKDGKKHLITTVIEHHAILHAMHALEEDGFEVTYLPADSGGRVRPESVRDALRPDSFRSVKLVR